MGCLGSIRCADLGRVGYVDRLSSIVGAMAAIDATVRTDHESALELAVEVSRLQDEGLAVSLPGRSDDTPASQLSELSQIIIAVGSAGGAGLVSKLVIEVIRRRRTTIEIQVGDRHVKLDADTADVEGVISHVFDQLSTFPADDAAGERSQSDGQDSASA